ncbi:MAG: hypothetical protein LBF77_11490 [Spirochaetaceae bacterium]|nr:hypothetical protein [Spirochaetaceae bacterium]
MKSGVFPPVRALILLAAVLGACATTGTQASSAGQAAGRGTDTSRALSRTEPAEKPLWVNAPPQSGTELYFTGISGIYGNAAGARKAARDDAFNQVVRYYGEYIQTSSAEKTSAAGIEGDSLEIYLTHEEDITRFAQAVVSQIGVDNYYTEVYTDPARGEVYQVYVLCQISKQKAETDIRDFARNISERYGNLLSTQETLAASLAMYAGVAEELRKNPLHRAAAYYDGPAGRTGLFDYCNLQINNLINSVSFAAIPSAPVEKGQLLTVMVGLSSAITPRLGNIPCKVSVLDGTGAAAGIPAAFYTPMPELSRREPSAGREARSSLPDHSFLLQIQTVRLDAGRYTVQIELLLNESVPAITRNPSMVFSFEVKPLNTVRVVSRDEDGRPLLQKVEGLLSAQGLLLVQENNAYRTFISLEMNEEKTANYSIVEPLLTITVELERDGTPLVTYTKKYPAFRHVTRSEVYGRAYRNIEQDLDENFAPQIRGLGK